MAEEIKETIMKLSDIEANAYCNWLTRKAIIDDLKEALTPAIEKKIRKVDPKFLGKLYNYPGDTTTHRISKVLSAI